IELADGLAVTRAQPAPAEPFDLLVAKSGPDAARVVGGDWLALIDSLLAHDGLAYIETAELAVALRLRFGRPPYQNHNFGAPATLWLARRKGALRLALPLEARSARRYLLDAVVAGVSGRGRVLRHAARALTRIGLLDYAVPRRALLLNRLNGTAQRDPVAVYVHDAVREAGLALKDPRLAFYARGDHNSNKVTFLLFDGDTPAVIVKLPRAPLYNARLEQEHRTLTSLAQAGVAPPGSYPEPLFLRCHDELAMVGQTVVTGSAFRNTTSGAADDPASHAAVEWITALGAASARERASGAPDPAAQFHALLDELCATYPVTPEERTFLRRQAEQLAACAVPLVFQHGDPGTWNIVVENRTRVKFLDWEDGDPDGMPLWDLFNFLESYSVWAGRLRGSRDDAAAVAAAFFQSTPYHRQLLTATAAYCKRIGLDRAAVEPLFYACWVDRALGIAPWIKGPIEQTRFFQLLRRAMQQRPGSELSCLFE
ncbi:MAG TPA: phosphotransferase, partial [Longimicrobiales bacterium]|nr:phosphotransferase [Longimicrobiales bacterium]